MGHTFIISAYYKSNSFILKIQWSKLQALSLILSNLPQQICERKDRRWYMYIYSIMHIHTWPEDTYIYRIAYFIKFLQLFYINYFLYIFGCRVEWKFTEEIQSNNIFTADSIYWTFNLLFKYCSFIHLLIVILMTFLLIRSISYSKCNVYK